MARPEIPITGLAEADDLLVAEPFALLAGMLLDQQVPMEWAFKGPFTLKKRLGGRLDPRDIAAMDVDDFVAICSEKPAVHRFPGSMGRRLWEASTHIVEHYDGNTERIWKGARSAEKVYERLRAVPGYGDEKARIFIAILGKRMGRTPAGWREVASPFGDDQPRSVADVADAASLNDVRSWKKMMKAAKKSKKDSAS